MNFDSLGLSEPLLRALKDANYDTPTLIQQKAIPAILEGRDVMAAAQTGTGKTAGFTLPLLQVLSNLEPAQSYKPKALILTPTRELAAQVQQSIETYGKYEKLKSGVVFGGVNINPQMRMLKRGIDILVATPGRLLDLFQQRAVQFSEIDVLILDEADRMLDMGFIHDIRRIISLLPKQRQNLMFSATFSGDIRKLAKTIVNNPVEIDVAPRNSTVKAISQGMYRVEKPLKAQFLEHLLSQNSDQTLVFSRTKHGANNLAKRLKRANISAEAIHGNKTQAQRTRVLADFKSDRVQVLVATDIAARGIDIDQLSMVINFDLPHVPEDYIHRIGRTGRAGASGQALSLVSSEEIKQLKAIERLIKQSIKEFKIDASEFNMRSHAVENRSSANATARQPNPSNNPGAKGNRRTDSKRPVSFKKKQKNNLHNSSRPRRAAVG